MHVEVVPTCWPMEVADRIAKPPSSSSSMASVRASEERRFATTMPDVAREKRRLKQAQVHRVML